MENAGHPSSETPAATNYFLQYISSRCVSWAWCPASDSPGYSITLSLGPREEAAAGPGASLVLLGAGRRWGWEEADFTRILAVPLAPPFIPTLGTAVEGPGWCALTDQAGPKFWLAVGVTSVTWISCPEQNPLGQWLLSCLLLPARFQPVGTPYPGFGLAGG